MQTHTASEPMVAGNQLRGVQLPRRILDQLSDPIRVVHNRDLGVMDVDLVVAELAEREHNHTVASGRQPSSRSVDANLTTSCLAFEDIRLKPTAAVDVADKHLLVHPHAHGIEQIAIDGDRANILRVAAGDRRGMDLGEEKLT